VEGEAGPNAGLELQAGLLILKIRGKRGQKRKSTALEAEADLEAGSSVPKGKVARTSDKTAIDIEVPWRALLAKMY
jgi:hypothetical protein